MEPRQIRNKEWNEIGTIQDREALQQIRETLAAGDSSNEIELFEGTLGRIVPLVEQEHPDLLIVDFGSEVTPDLRALEPVALRYPAMSIILISPKPTHEFLVQAMRIGVREVLPSRLPEHGLKQAVARIQQRVSWATTPQTQGKIFALMACKGGSGATFLATNLAYALASGKDSRVLLIDFNLHFGEALLYISDVAPPSTVADVARQIQRLDGAFLESSTVQVLHNFGVLAAPESPEKVVEVKPESVERLLNVAVNHYDYVILDISRNLDAVAIKALDRADMIFPCCRSRCPSSATPSA
jgi:pilus assembly protein CpaE